MTQVTVPPMLSWRSRKAAMRDSMREVASVLGQRTGRKESTSWRVIFSIKERKSGFVEAEGWVGVGGKRNSLPTEEVKATISMP